MCFFWGLNYAGAHINRVDSGGRIPFHAANMLAVWMLSIVTPPGRSDTHYLLQCITSSTKRQLELLSSLQKPL